MSTVARCALTELPVDGCEHCRPSPASRPLHDAYEISVVFTAQYGGKCADCGGRYEPGDRIGRLRDGGGYLCPGCLP